MDGGIETAAGARDAIEDQVNTHIGGRLRRRRKLLGLTQMGLGAATQLQFQQIQKYECGETRIGAARLHTLASALHAPINYFFQGLDCETPPPAGVTAEEIMASAEARELMESYAKLTDRVRAKLRDFAKALGEAPILAAAEA